MSLYYSPIYVEHLKLRRGLAPQNGPAWTADGVGAMEGPGVKTSMTVWLKLEPDGKIGDLAWRSLGVPEAVAFASIMVEHVLGEGLDVGGLARLQPQTLMDLLGGVPSHRGDGALLVLQAARRALSNADVLEGLGPQLVAPDEVACHCMGVTFNDLRLAAAVDLDPLNLQRRTGFGTGCGTCLAGVRDYLDDLVTGSR